MHGDSVSGLSYIVQSENVIFRIWNTSVSISILQLITNCHLNCKRRGMAHHSK